MRRRMHFVGLCLAIAALASAQNAAADEPSSTRHRPLSAREGREILSAASWQDSDEGRTKDCSHLVHDLYEQAGYSYPYASSRDLYFGAENFVRVSKPQPGDLVVWPGHVGIVVDPRKHAFFSSVNSGLQTEYYNSAYWRSRGRVRFYRYLTDSPSRADKETTKRASRTAEQEHDAPGGVGRGAKEPPTLRAVKTPRATVAEPHGEVAPANATPFEISANKMLHIQGKRPEAAEVAQGLEEMNQAAGELLRTGNLEQLGRPVIVYRELQVTDIEIKGKHGTARAQMETMAALSGKRAEAQLGEEETQLDLLRTKKGWTMKRADEKVYVPRDAALRVLATRLVLLTEGKEASPEKEHEQAQIIHVLNLLVEEN